MVGVALQPAQVVGAGEQGGDAALLGEGWEGNV